MQPGDVLVDVNGNDVAASTPEELSRVLALLAGAPGSPVTMIFRRYGTHAPASHLGMPRAAGWAGRGAAAAAGAAAHIAQHVVTVFRTATAASSARPPAAAHAAHAPSGPPGAQGPQGEEGAAGSNGGAGAGAVASACTPSDLATDMAARVAGYDTIIGAGDGLWGGRDRRGIHYLDHYLHPGAGGLDEWKRAVLLQARL